MTQYLGPPVSKAAMPLQYARPRCVFLRHRYNVPRGSLGRFRISPRPSAANRVHVKSRSHRRRPDRISSKVYQAISLPRIELFPKHCALQERPVTLSLRASLSCWTKTLSSALGARTYGVMARMPTTAITGEPQIGKMILAPKLRHSFEESTAVRLIIDEAQNISRERLANPRIMTKATWGENELSRLILLGRPKPRETISAHDRRQFAQRVMACFALHHMDLRTTGGYTHRHLQYVGGIGAKLTRGPIALVCRFGDGVLRMVNEYADFALGYAVSASQNICGEMKVCEVNADGLFVALGSADHKDFAK